MWKYQFQWFYNYLLSDTSQTCSDTVFHILWQVHYNLAFVQCWTTTTTTTTTTYFDVHVTVHRDKFLTTKSTGWTNFSNLFLEWTVHVSDSSSVHHQEFFTVHSNGTQVCWKLESRIRMFIEYPDSAPKLSANLYTITMCTVKNSWWWTEKRSETCTVHSKNKFEKIVHLVAFVIRNNNILPL
jgi:hypothetical protein